MVLEVGRNKTQDTPPDHGTNTEYDPLLEGQPVEYIKHVQNVGRYVSSSRNAAYEARGSANSPVEAAPLLSEYIRCNRKVNITFNVRFLMYENNFKSVTSHDLG